MTVAAVIFWLSLFVLAEIYLLHPLLLFLLSRFIHRPVKRDPAHRPSFTLFIPCYNEAANIAAKLENALALDYPADKLEILVADDGSADDTVALARRYEDRGVRVVAFEENRGKTTVMNELSPACRGEIIVYSDGNVMLEPDALLRFAELFADPSVGCVGGYLEQRPPSTDGATATAYGNSFIRRYEDRQKIWESRMWSCIYVQGGHMALRRELYHPSAPEVSPDTLLTVSTVAFGKRTIYDPRVRAWEETQTASGDEFRRRVRLSLLEMGFFPYLHQVLPLRGHLLYHLNFFLRKTLRQTTPLWLLTLLLSGVVCAFSGAVGAVTAHVGVFASAYPYLWLSLAQGAFYLAAAVGALLHDRLRGLPALPYYTTATFAAMAVAWWRFCKGRRAVTWKPRQD